MSPPPNTVARARPMAMSRTGFEFPMAAIPTDYSSAARRERDGCAPPFGDGHSSDHYEYHLLTRETNDQWLRVEPECVTSPCTSESSTEDTMQTRLHWAASIALSAIPAGMLSGCQTSGGTIEVGLTSSGQPLTTAVGSPGGIANDAGVIAGPELVLDVSRVDVHIAGDGIADDNNRGGGLAGSGPSSGMLAPLDDGGWTTIFAGIARVDVL